MYLDKCILDTSKLASTWVTHLPHEHYYDDCLKHTFHSERGSVHVWGGISQDWKSPPIFLCGTGRKGVTAKDYQKQLLERLGVVSPAFLGLYDYTASLDSQYDEDQAPIHGTLRLLVKVMSDLGIHPHPHPAISPNLKPIEDVWHIMK